MPTRPPLHQPSHGNTAERRLARDNDRGTAQSRGYDAAWRKVRDAHLQAEPCCRFCRDDGIIRAADMVDHIEPITDRPDLRLVDSNLRSLCNPHHVSLTARQVAAGHVGMVGRIRRT